MQDKGMSLVRREDILNILSDAELEKVTSMEEPLKLQEGDEYIDLGHIDRGIQEVHAKSNINVGNIIPHSAVKEETWKKIIKKIPN
jgi:hypothetical protein